MMSPWAYRDSLKVSVEKLELRPRDKVLDVGCGTGMALEQFKALLARNEIQYIGVDILAEGLQSSKKKLNRLGIENEAGFIQADFTSPIPFKAGSLSKILAHFSVYTLRDRKARVSVWRSLCEVMKPGGILVASNPSLSYCPKKIIEDSLSLLAREKGRGASLLARLYYPVTEKLGLRHIKHQLDHKIWHAYSEQDFKEELIEAGLTSVHSEAVYGDSGWLVVARKT